MDYGKTMINDEGEALMSVENVTLRLIMKENELECINLKPRDEQMNLVATNSDSLIHAIKETTSKPYGIYAEDQMVVSFYLTMKSIVTGITGFCDL